MGEVMDREEKVVVGFIAWIFLMLSVAIVGGLYIENEKVKAIKAFSKARITISRPELCGQYYNDGTDRWMKCMGVEYK